MNEIIIFFVALIIIEIVRSIVLSISFKIDSVGYVECSRNPDGSPYVQFMFYGDYEKVYQKIKSKKQVTFKVVNKEKEETK